MWEGKYQSADNTEYGRKAHTNTWKLIRNISKITDVFFNQRRANVCEHTVKIVSHDSF